MPIFEYHCQACGFRFERLTKPDSTEPPECPSCASTEVKRDISPFSSTSSSSQGCFPSGGG